MINLMFRLFRIALSGVDDNEPLEIGEEQGDAIVALAEKHDLCHLIGFALQLKGITPRSEWQLRADNALNSAVYRYTKMNIDVNNIVCALSEAGIVHVPLKGAVIRELYTEPWQRTSCDIDVLVKKEQVQQARAVLEEQLKYKYVSSWNYEHSYRTLFGNHIELHHEISDENSKIFAILDTVWDDVKPEGEGSLSYKMSHEFYYLCHIAHMLKHFMCGGCGIRSFIDLWVMKNGWDMNVEKRDRLLERTNLVLFAKSCEELADVWFDFKTHTDTTRQLEKFIITGGNYGSVDNMVRVRQTAAGGRLSYVISRIFLSYNSLKAVYPGLEKRKILYPFYQVKRWFRVFKKGKVQKTVNELKVSRNIASEKSEDAKKLLLSLGIG